MDSLVASAARLLAAGDPLGALKRVALRDDPPALALLCSVPPQCQAQAPPGLSIGTYAGLTITGSVGTVYTVQYNTNLTQPDGWQGAGIVQLPSSPYLWVDTAAPVAGQRFYRAVEGPTNLGWIPPGTFTMGSPSNEIERQAAEGPQTVVTLTSGFFMRKYPLTQGDYLAVIGSNPSYFRNGTDGTNSGGTGDTITNESRHPVEMVSWNDADGRRYQAESLAGIRPTGSSLCTSSAKWRPRRRKPSASIRPSAVKPLF